MIQLSFNYNRFQTLNKYAVMSAVISVFLFVLNSRAFEWATKENKLAYLSFCFFIQLRHQISGESLPADCNQSAHLI